MALQPEMVARLLGSLDLSETEHLMLQLLLSADGGVVTKTEIVLIVFGVFSTFRDADAIPDLIDSLKQRIVEAPGLKIVESADGRGYRLECVSH
jgi:DNA-binding response OmpR family regulator